MTKRLLLCAVLVISLAGCGDKNPTKTDIEDAVAISQVSETVDVVSEVESTTSADKRNVESSESTSSETENNEVTGSNENINDDSKIDKPIVSSDIGKVYFDGIINGDYQEGCIDVEVRYNSPKKIIEFTPEHFPDIDIESIHHGYRKGPDETKDGTYYQSLHIKLKDKDEKTLLESIKKLEKLDFVKWAMPAYIVELA